MKRRVTTFLVCLSALLCLAAMVAWGFGIARIGYYFSTNVGTQPLEIEGGRGGFTAKFPRYEAYASAWKVELRRSELFDGSRVRDSCVVEVAPPVAYFPSVNERMVTIPYWLLLMMFGAAPVIWFRNRYRRRTAINNRTASEDEGEEVTFPVGRGEKSGAFFLVLSAVLFLSVAITWISALIGWGFHAEVWGIAERKLEVMGMRGGLNIVVNEEADWEGMRFRVDQRYLFLPHVLQEYQRPFVVPSHRVPQWVSPTRNPHQIIFPYWLLILLFGAAPALRWRRDYVARREKKLLGEAVAQKRAEHPHLDIKEPME